MPWLDVGNAGAEYGSLTWKDGEQAPKAADRIEIYYTNLDQSTDAFDRYYIAQGDKIVDMWPIMGRSGAAQRRNPSRGFLVYRPPKLRGQFEAPT